MCEVRTKVVYNFTCYLIPFLVNLEEFVNSVDQIQQPNKYLKDLTIHFQYLFLLNNIFYQNTHIINKCSLQNKFFINYTSIVAFFSPLACFKSLIRLKKKLQSNPITSMNYFMVFSCFISFSQVANFIYFILSTFIFSFCYTF